MSSNNRPPTIADVAQRAGVSIATVSRVLNDKTYVAAFTAGHVRDAIAELDYRPRAAARTLASRKTNTIGLLLPEISGAFFQPLLRGVEASAGDAGYDLQIHTTRNPYLHNNFRRPLGEHNTDGLLVFTDSLDAKELIRLHSIGFPVVLLHQSPPQFIQMPVVTIENQSGAQKIVDHLIEIHNRRRIVFLLGQDSHEDSLWREKGYRVALKSHAIRFDPSLVAPGGFNRDQAKETILQILLDGLEFDAIFTGDDDAATGVLEALHHAGMRVPQDIAVVGFDDAPFSRYLTPPLTTIRAPTEEVGRTAISQLLKLIHGEKYDPITLLPTELVIRSSCGCQGE